MKAILLKDVIDRETGEDYRKGQIIDIGFAPETYEYAVYHLYWDEEDKRSYKHWFDLDTVKIIDTEGYDLERAIEIMIEEDKQRTERAIQRVREAFSKAKK